MNVPASAVAQALEKLTGCQHRYASDYRFLFQDAAHDQRELLGRRCLDCGAVETAHIPWVQPRLVRELEELLKKLVETNEEKRA
jgi:hypothetical protein